MERLNFQAIEKKWQSIFEKQKLYNAIMDVIDEFERYWAYDTLRTIEEAEQFLENTTETEEIPYILADTKVPYLKICRPEQNSK